jgi:hypothetical protein
MPTFHFVTKSAKAGVPVISPPCATIDEALRGAKFMLGNGATSVWIADSDGKLVLPADQVRLRSDALDLHALGAAHPETLSPAELRADGPMT